VARAGGGQAYVQALRVSAGETEPVESVTGRAVRTRQPVVSNDIAADGMLISPGTALAQGFRAMVGLPLVVDEEAVGVIALYAAEAGFFNEEEMHLLEELAGDVSFGLGYIERENKVHHLAYYDALTGLPNRKLYQERLVALTAGQRERPDSRMIAVVIVDVRAFHVINDNLGRHSADALLKEVAQRLRKNLRSSDTLGRIGGDQFGLILTDVTSESHIGALLEKLFGSLAEPYGDEDNPIRPAFKGGVTVFRA